MNFRINLTQFYIHFSRQEYQTDVLNVSFNAWDSQVSSYTPFHFSFTPPLIEKFDDKFVLFSTQHLAPILILCFSILNINIKANYVRGAESNVKLEGKHKRLSRKSSHQIYEKEKLLLLLKRLGRIVKTKERLFDSLQSTVLTTNRFI